jgi:hypothetical protein
MARAAGRSNGLLTCNRLGHSGRGTDPMPAPCQLRPTQPWQTMAQDAGVCRPPARQPVGFRPPPVRYPPASCQPARPPAGSPLRPGANPWGSGVNFRSTPHTPPRPEVQGPSRNSTPALSLHFLQPTFAKRSFEHPSCTPGSAGTSAMAIARSDIKPRRTSLTASTYREPGLATPTACLFAWKPGGGGGIFEFFSRAPAT